MLNHSLGSYTYGGLCLQLHCCFRKLNIECVLVQFDLYLVSQTIQDNQLKCSLKRFNVNLIIELLFPAAMSLPESPVLQMTQWCMLPEINAYT